MNERVRRSGMELALINKCDAFRIARLRVINDKRLLERSYVQLRKKFDAIMKQAEDLFNDGKAKAAAVMLGYMVGLKWWAQIMNNHIDGPGLTWGEDMEYLLTAIHEALV